MTGLLGLYVEAWSALGAADVELTVDSTPAPRVAEEAEEPQVRRQGIPQPRSADVSSE
jgi:hypothetical protein